MKFLPHERLKIKTLLSSHEILKRLDNSVEPKRYFRFFGTRDKPYEGKIEGTHFDVSPIINYSNSFLPMIKGDVQTEISGCSIYISMQPHDAVLAFMVLWLGSMGYLFFLILSPLISSLSQLGTVDPSPLLVPVGMFAFGYGLLLGGFKVESIKSKTYFRELFEAKEFEEMGIANPFNRAG